MRRRGGLNYELSKSRGAWVAPSVGHLTRGFGSGHDLRVVGWSPLAGTALSGECAGHSPSAPPSLAFLSLK